jgi:prepilin-type processing-associated H-X9-DG protein
MNIYYSGLPKGVSARPVADGMFNGKLSGIRKPSEKILFICEDERNVNDGAYDPRPDQWAAATGSDPQLDLLASRHETRKSSRTRHVTSVRSPNEDARGNVVFADGHGEFFGRKDALRQRYTGNPNPDPAGF